MKRYTIPANRAQIKFIRMLSKSAVASHLLRPLPPLLLNVSTVFDGNGEEEEKFRNSIPWDFSDKASSFICSIVLYCRTAGWWWKGVSDPGPWTLDLCPNILCACVTYDNQFLCQYLGEPGSIMKYDTTRLKVFSPTPISNQDSIDSSQ